VGKTKCPKCGLNNPEGNSFCGRCGASLLFSSTSYAAGQSDIGLAKRNLETGEKILWQGKPEFAPFILSGFGGIIPGLFFFGFALFWTTTASAAGAPGDFLLVGTMFMLIGLFILLGGPLTQWLRYRNTEYVVTDHRIITQTGAIGLDTRYIENEWIREVYVNVSLMDRLFGTGSVMVSTASGMVGGRGPNAMRPSLASLNDPYAVQKIIWDSIKRKEGGRE
jgi:membrane protein YdbS with pleckstrin-like domain